MVGGVEVRPARPALRIGAILVGLALVVGLIWVGWYRSSYYAWPWQSDSTRLAYCGRDYQEFAPAVTRAEMVAHAGPVQPVFRVPAWGPKQQVFAPTRGFTNTDPSCPLALFRQTGTDRFIGYEILGGP